MTEFKNEIPISDRACSLKALSINSDCSTDSCLGYSEDDETPLDPKHLNLVHEELEKLNIATDVINKLEVQLDQARASFREIQASWSERLKELSKKYSSAITKARPYYEALVQERGARDDSQRCAIRFERATSLLAVAKQQVNLTQDSLTRQSTIHPECLEVLNHHICRVAEAEDERILAEEAHREAADKVMALSDLIRRMEKDHRSSIKKSRNYFDQRLKFTTILENQKDMILRLEKEVRQKKFDYTTSLRNLERISDSIHEQRSLGGQSTSRSERDAPANPPPYLPTAPPPYEEDEARYSITQEADDVIDPVLTLISASEGRVEWREQRERDRPRSLGSGVILLAQQLMGGGEKQEKQPNDAVLASCQTDVSYRTRPEGISTPSDSSEVSSLASVRTSGVVLSDDDVICMIRSHSTLINEIESAHDRLGLMLRRSVSDAERESGTDSLGPDHNMIC